MELITKDMTVGDVVRKYPRAAAVFQSYGLHCVGCGVSYSETIEEGSLGHGMDEETVAQMVRDANTVAQESREDTQQGDMVSITNKAIQKVREFMKQERKEGAFLRLGVTKGGCAGMSYDLALEQNKSPDDEVIEKEDMVILINKKDLEFLNGVNIDYVESLQSSGFKIDNPNAKSSCGCGSSFS